MIAAIIAMSFLVGILYDLVINLPSKEEQYFEKVLNSVEPTLRGNTLSLYTCDSLIYLNITYDFVNDVFFEFDMDMGSRETPTEIHLQITRDYFNNYLNI